MIFQYIAKLLNQTADHLSAPSTRDLAKRKHREALQAAAQAEADAGQLLVYARYQRDLAAFYENIPNDSSATALRQSGDQTPYPGAPQQVG